MITVANALVFIILCGIFWTLRWVGETYGWSAGMSVSGLIILAVTCHQFWYRKRYGRWFDGPVISDVSAPPETAGDGDIKDSRR